MMNEGLSAGDILALTRDQDGMGNAWNNPFIYLVWLALLGGNGGIFGNRDNGALQSSLTRSDLFEGFNNQDVRSLAFSKLIQVKPSCCAVNNTTNLTFNNAGLAATFTNVNVVITKVA